MLASRLPTILPPITEVEAIESAAITSISEQGFSLDRWHQRPFRAPYHRASGVALVGGGSTPQPGEISLADLGMLFLDELTEFDRRELEVLREPSETGRITISRASRRHCWIASTFTSRCRVMCCATAPHRRLKAVNRCARYRGAAATIQRHGMTNAVMRNRGLAATCKLTAEDYALLDQAMTRFKLSTRV
jgi:predicted ATPase with chaperone activity